MVNALSVWFLTVKWTGLSKQNVELVVEDHNHFPIVAIEIAGPNAAAAANNIDNVLSITTKVHVFFIIHPTLAAWTPISKNI